MKHAEEIMQILEAFDLTHSLRDAAELAGADHKTVAHWVARRDAGMLSPTAQPRSRIIESYLDKIEEWMDASKGKVRADVVHDKLVAMGFAGSERTTRRAVAEVRAAYRAGRRRVHRPWVVEPGLWFQWDYGDGPVVGGTKTTLFCAWLSWSRFRVVIAIRDKTLPTVIACLDAALRAFGGYVGDRCQDASSSRRLRSPSKIFWRPTWPLETASSRCRRSVGRNSIVVTKNEQDSQIDSKWQSNSTGRAQ